MRIPFLLLAMVFVLGSSLGSASVVAEDSLEGLLRRLRRERDELRETITDRVTHYVAELEQLAEQPNERKLESTRKALTALGPEAVPLLVEMIDPGISPTESSKARQFRAREFRASEITEVLALARPTSITEQLLELATSGSPDGRVNALEVLVHSPEPERVGADLAELFEGSSGEFRARVLAALARLGGEQADAAVAKALSSGDDELLATALSALAETGRAEAAGAVLDLTRSPKGPRHVENIMAYYQAVPAAVDREHALALVTLAKHVAVSEKVRVQVLDGLGQLPLDLDSELRRALEPIAESGTRQSREAALALLYVLGDNSSRKPLFKPYDDAIKRRPGWAQAFVERAQMHYRVQDYRKAISDYKDALELQAEARQHDSDTHLGIARCYARQKDFRKAENYLRSAQLPLKVLRRLGSRDSDFAEMAQDSRYRSAFHLESD